MSRLPEAPMIRILIADDHAIVRAGLKQFLSGEPDLEVAGEAQTGREVIDMVKGGDWDLVLLDISMPDASGVDTLLRLRHIKPTLPVLILSGFPEHQYAINLMRAGANGYINKDSAPAELVGAVRTVMRGHRYVSARLAQILAADLTNQFGKRPLHEGLSSREFQIFRKLASGMGVSQIAESLNLSVKTVSTYRTRVLEKMAMKTNADLTSYAIHNRLID